LSFHALTTLPTTPSSGYVSADEDYDAFGSCNSPYSPPGFETRLSPFCLPLLASFFFLRGWLDFDLMFFFSVSLPLRDSRNDMIRSTMMTR
jgi:hypothetical protein